jgi:hypothetical protein
MGGIRVNSQQEVLPKEIGFAPLATSGQQQSVIALAIILAAHFVQGEKL